MMKSKKEMEELILKIKEKGLTPEGVFPYSYVGVNNEGEVFVIGRFLNPKQENYKFNLYGAEDYKQHFNKTIKIKHEKYGGLQ